jgi:hypothetical protein
LKNCLNYDRKKVIQRKGIKFHGLVFKEARRRGIKKLMDTIKVKNDPSLNLTLKIGLVYKEVLSREGDPYAYILKREF